MELSILYEDADIVVCLKPVGVLSQEGGMPELLRRQCGAEAIYCVHRLDRAVGGLMVYAKTREAAAGLSRQMAAGEFQKEYRAVVQGEAEERAELRDLLYHDAARNKSYVVKRMRRGVREAALAYETLARVEGLSLLRVRLMTGRSHQIRVQLAARGLPLVGDARYGSGYREGDIALWSAALGFRHPRTGQLQSHTAPPPPHWPWTAFG